MSIGRALCAAVAVALLASACSDDGGDGDGEDGDGDGGETLEPGREVMGCFDCSEVEYCIILVADDDTETHRCAEADCGLACSCIVGDGKKRHDECGNYSCQEDSGLLYCSG
jgi:hypothetical protein